MKDFQASRAQTQDTGSGEWLQGCMHNEKKNEGREGGLRQQAAIFMDEC